MIPHKTTVLRLVPGSELESDLNKLRGYLLHNRAKINKFKLNEIRRKYSHYALKVHKM